MCFPAVFSELNIFCNRLRIKSRIDFHKVIMPAFILAFFTGLIALIANEEVSKHIVGSVLGQANIDLMLIFVYPTLLLLTATFAIASFTKSSPLLKAVSQLSVHLASTALNLSAVAIGVYLGFFIPVLIADLGEHTLKNTLFDLLAIAGSSSAYITFMVFYLPARRLAAINEIDLKMRDKKIYIFAFSTALVFFIYISASGIRDGNHQKPDNPVAHTHE